MSSAPKDVEAKIGNVVNAWTKLAATKTFAGMTLDQFNTAIKPSVDARQAIIDLDNEMTNALDTRDDADKDSLALVLQVVDSVKGDPDYGQDSALYEAMGYIRKSERSSGKTNKAQPVAKPA